MNAVLIISTRRDPAVPLLTLIVNELDRTGNLKQDVFNRILVFASRSAQAHIMRYALSMSLTGSSAISDVNRLVKFAWEDREESLSPLAAAASGRFWRAWNGAANTSYPTMPVHNWSVDLPRVDEEKVHLYASLGWAGPVDPILNRYKIRIAVVAHMAKVYHKQAPASVINKVRTFSAVLADEVVRVAGAAGVDP
ncbi:hypothetical protein HKX48_000728 [Thoreauomyces humboldtii]|nr:hypothetical protein HKX48_000728 [Thoreauomyces humboldtii]